jgi:hypothetical protein
VNVVAQKPATSVQFGTGDPLQSPDISFGRFERCSSFIVESVVPTGQASVSPHSECYSSKTFFIPHQRHHRQTRFVHQLSRYKQGDSAEALGNHLKRNGYTKR